MHSRDAAKRQINISDSDSDLLISMDDQASQTKSLLIGSKQPKKNCSDDKTESHHASNSNDFINSSGSKNADSGIGKTQTASSSPSALEQNEQESIQKSDNLAASKTPAKPSDLDENAPSTEYRDVSTPIMNIDLQSPSFQRVGFSQCKPGKFVKRTRLIEDPESYPEPVYVEKENLRRRVVFESPRTPLNVAVSKKKGKLNVLETPESKSSKILVEDTPEHLVGVRMVTRRLRKVLQQTVPDSLNF